MQAETSWALTVLGYLAKLVLGILGYAMIHNNKVAMIHINA